MTQPPRQRQRDSLPRRWHASLKGDRTTQAAQVLLQVLITVTQVGCTAATHPFLQAFTQENKASPTAPALCSGAKRQAPLHGCSQCLPLCGMRACCWCRRCCRECTGGTGDACQPA